MDTRLRRKPTEMGTVAPQDGWLGAFHAGDRRVIERIYRDHYQMIATTVGRLLSATDAETVTHEVFYRLLSDRSLRENFAGGSFVAWLTRVAQNSALDHRRRYGREQPYRAEGAGALSDVRPELRPVEDDLDAKRLIERFCQECLPAEWRAVFDARFLRHLTQRAAAAQLRMHRSTLAYQEGRIRALLAQFLLRTERP